MKELYDVLFLGPASEDQEAVERLRNALREHLRLSPKEVERMLASAPVRVKRGASWEEAQRVKGLLESIGARASVQREEVVSEGVRGLPPRTMKCPQCGYLQPQSDECIRCGVIISKYQRYQELRKERALMKRGLPAWERGEGGISAFAETVKGVLFSPTRFFQGMTTQQGLGSPLLFGVIVGTAGGLMPLLWSLLMSVRGTGITLFSSTLVILYGILLPAFVAVGIFVTSGVLHLCLMLVGGERSGFEATFRVVAYGQASQLWGVLPLVGPLVSAIYALVLYIVGLREVHGIGTGRAAVAVFLPAVAFMVVIGLVVSALLIPFIMGMKG